MDKCGHCDNCTRAPETIEHKDVTIEAWQILKILEAVDAQGGRQTIAGLSDLARGLGGGSFEASGKRKKSKEKVQLDYDAVAGGKVGLSKDVRAPSFLLLISRFFCFVFPCPSLSSPKWNLSRISKR
jgi:ATP-dependent DNA helicase Q1